MALLDISATRAQTHSFVSFMRVDSVNSGMRMKFPKELFIFLRGRGGWWDLGGVTEKKTVLKGGASKKNKGKGGHVKYYVYWRVVVGKKLVTGGGHATF